MQLKTELTKTYPQKTCETNMIPKKKPHILLTASTTCLHTYTKVSTQDDPMTAPKQAIYANRRYDIHCQPKHYNS